MLQILDTTLRDGSYVVNFQFAKRDITTLGALIDAQGIHYIELGHGLGLGAWRDSSKSAACNDDEYLEAASAVIKNAKWGMFFIPGIGEIADIEKAARYGIDFIRIGTNVTELFEAEPYIRRAKELGIFVSSNFMKTYVLSPDEVGVLAVKAEEYGADIVCLVDSAGGMFPEDIAAYIRAIQKRSKVSVGFHGHNNMGMVMANTLRAVETGANIVDSSLRGIGRSSGNAATEILLLALKRHGMDMGIDPLALMDIAEQHIDPILRNHPQVDSLNIVSGYAQFHSSFLGMVMTCSKRYNVDPRELIIRVCDEDRINADVALVDRIARGMKPHSNVVRRLCLAYNKSSFLKAESFVEQVRVIGKEACAIAQKYGKKSVFNIVQPYGRKTSNRVSPVIYEGDLFVIGSAEINDPSLGSDVTKAVDGMVDVLFLDCDVKSASSLDLIRSVQEVNSQAFLARYSDLQAWSKSIVWMAREKLKGLLAGTRILIAGHNTLSQHCANLFELFGSSVFILGPDESAKNVIGKFGVIVCFEQVRSMDILQLLDDSGFIIDGLIGSFSEECLDYIHARKIQTFRPDMHVIIESELIAAIGMKYLVAEMQGSGILNGIPVSAAGVIASRGTVIVDSVFMPAKAYGVADGRGALLPFDLLTDYEGEKLKTVESFLL